MFKWPEAANSMLNIFYEWHVAWCPFISAEGLEPHMTHYLNYHKVWFTGVWLTPTTEAWMIKTVDMLLQELQIFIFGKCFSVSVILDTNTGDRVPLPPSNQWIFIAFKVHSRCICFISSAMISWSSDEGRSCLCACFYRFHTQVLLTWYRRERWLQRWKMSAYVGVHMCNSRRNWVAVRRHVTPVSMAGRITWSLLWK